MRIDLLLARTGTPALPLDCWLADLSLPQPNITLLRAGQTQGSVQSKSVLTITRSGRVLRGYFVVSRPPGTRFDAARSAQGLFSDDMNYIYESIK